LGGYPEGKIPLRRNRGTWKNDIKVDLAYKTQESAEHIVSLRIRKRTVLLYTAMILLIIHIKRVKFLGSLRNYLAKYYSPVWNGSINYLFNGRSTKSTVLIKSNRENQQDATV
jgi:hypothetical protein